MLLYFCETDISKQRDVLAENDMNGVLGHDTALQGYPEPRTTWANEMNAVLVGIDFEFCLNYLINLVLETSNEIRCLYKNEAILFQETQN